jgi:hypothetical protein
MKTIFTRSDDETLRSRKPTRKQSRRRKRSSSQSTYPENHPRHDQQKLSTFRATLLVLNESSHNSISSTENGHEIYIPIVHTSSNSSVPFLSRRTLSTSFIDGLYLSRGERGEVLGREIFSQVRLGGGRPMKRVSKGIIMSA